MQQISSAKGKLQGRKIKLNNLMNGTKDEKCKKENGSRRASVKERVWLAQYRLSRYWFT